MIIAAIIAIIVVGDMALLYCCAVVSGKADRRFQELYRSEFNT